MTEHEYLQIIHDTAEAAERIQAERDELLAALKNAHRALTIIANGKMDDERAVSIMHQNRSVARRAIAKIETNQE
jgi:hypothetical protein